tara:strand:+ start:1152 stop:3011 length:1860 start_codon:yes stop_codon:yes gene_type:complete
VVLSVFRIISIVSIFFKSGYAYDGCHLEKKEKLDLQAPACEITYYKLISLFESVNQPTFILKTIDPYYFRYSIGQQQLVRFNDPSPMSSANTDGIPDVSSCDGNPCLPFLETSWLKKVSRGPGHYKEIDYPSLRSFRKAIEAFDQKYPKNQIFIEYPKLNDIFIYPAWFSKHSLKSYLPEVLQKKIISFGLLTAGGFMIQYPNQSHDLYYFDDFFQTKNRETWRHFYQLDARIITSLTNAQVLLPGVTALDLKRILLGTAVKLENFQGKKPISFFNSLLFSYVVKGLSEHWEKEKSSIQELLKDPSFFQKLRTESAPSKELPRSLIHSSCEQIEEQFILFTQKFLMAPDRDDFRKEFIDFYQSLLDLGIMVELPKENDYDRLYGPIHLHNLFSNLKAQDKIEKLKFGVEKLYILLEQGKFDSYIRKKIYSARLNSSERDLYSHLYTLRRILSLLNENKFLYQWERKALRKKIKKINMYIRKFESSSEQLEIFGEEELLSHIDESQGLNLTGFNLTAKNFLNGTYKNLIIKQLETEKSPEVRKAILYQVIYGLYEFRNYEMTGKNMAAPILKKQVKSIVKAYKKNSSQKEIQITIEEISSVTFQNAKDQKMILKILNSKN